MSASKKTVVRFCKECGKQLCIHNHSEYCYACDGNDWMKRHDIPMFCFGSRPLEEVLTGLEMSSERSLI